MDEDTIDKLDKKIEKMENQKISQIFELKGEAYFRELEFNVTINSGKIFLDKIVSQEVPYLEQLKKTSGNLKPFNKIITIFGLIYYSIIMVLFFFVSINYFLKIGLRHLYQLHSFS